MINFSGISKKTLIGKLLRLLLRCIPRSFILPILQGPNKGLKWIKGKGVSGYWLGCYELLNQTMIAKNTEPGMICYDIGANVGFYTLMFSRLAGASGKVYSFEPNPFNLSYISRHLCLNKIANVEVYGVGLYNENKIMPLTLDSSESRTSSISSKDTFFKIPVCSIDTLVSDNHILPPDIVKIDVEGAELEVLMGMRESLKNNYPKLFVSVHSNADRKAVYRFLVETGYSVYNLHGVPIEDCIKCNEIFAKA